MEGFMVPRGSFTMEYFKASGHGHRFLPFWLHFEIFFTHTWFPPFIRKIKTFVMKKEGERGN